MLRYTVFLSLVVLSAVLMRAQAAPCNESAIKEGKVPVADDAFAYMPPYGKPVVGKPAIQGANKKSFSDRTHITRSWRNDHRIVATPSGDMAYEFGTMQIGYDSKSEGHQDFKAVMLIVYKLRDGICQEVAMTMQPLEEGQGKP